MRTLLRSLALFWVTLAFVCLIDARVFAQGAVTKSSLGGVVQDASGGVAPGASIVVTNVATGVKNETVSNGTGFGAQTDSAIRVAASASHPVWRRTISTTIRQTSPGSSSVPATRTLGWSGTPPIICASASR